MNARDTNTNRIATSLPLASLMSTSRDSYLTPNNSAACDVDNNTSYQQEILMAALFCANMSLKEEGEGNVALGLNAANSANNPILTSSPLRPYSATNDPMQHRLDWRSLSIDSGVDFTSLFLDDSAVPTPGALHGAQNLECNTERSPRKYCWWNHTPSPSLDSSPLLVSSSNPPDFHNMSLPESLPQEHGSFWRQSVTDFAIPSGSMDHYTKQRYKTELCASYLFDHSGHCEYGSKCQYAHGEHELRLPSKHPKYKSSLCVAFHLGGVCPYGRRCDFIHNENPAQLQRVRELINTYHNYRRLYPHYPEDITISQLTRIMMPHLKRGATVYQAM